MDETTKTLVDLTGGGFSIRIENLEQRSFGHAMQIVLRKGTFLLSRIEPVLDLETATFGLLSEVLREMAHSINMSPTAGEERQAEPATPKSWGKTFQAEYESLLQRQAQQRAKAGK